VSGAATAHFSETHVSVVCLSHTNVHVLHVCIHLYLDSKTASIIATSIVCSKLDYCNSVYHNLPKSQISEVMTLWCYTNAFIIIIIISTRFQHIKNSLARAVVRVPKSSHCIVKC